MCCCGVLDSMANIKDSQYVGNKSFRIELLLIQQVLVNTHTWIHQGHHRNVRPRQVAGFHHSSDSNTRMCWTECLCTMNRISCHLWPWDPNTSIQGLTCCSTFEQVVILIIFFGTLFFCWGALTHNCCAKWHTGSFLPLDHPPDVVNYQPWFVSADHLVLFLGATPQLHRTNNRPQDRQ